MDIYNLHPFVVVVVVSAAATVFYNLVFSCLSCLSFRCVFKWWSSVEL